MKNLVRPGTKLDLFLTKNFSSELFTYQAIFAMLLPLILDSFFVNLINLFTTAMISSSSQESVTAVSLVTPLAMMIYSIYAAISAGGTVVVAQYKGRGNEEKMRKAAGQAMLATSLAAILFAAVIALGAAPFVQILFGSADAPVKEKAVSYLIGVSLSFIFHSFFQGTFSVFRGLGETKVCLRLTILINLIHLMLSYLFINILLLDIMGTILSLLIARFIGGSIAVYMIMRRKSSLRISFGDIFRLDFSILKSIFKLGIPFTLEQLFFNGGGMLVQIYIVRLGTVSMAANAIANSAFTIIYTAGLAVSNLSVTVIGQCIGFGDSKQARHYGIRLVRLGTFMSAISVLVFMPLMPFILRLYQAPANTLSLIYQLLFIALIPMLLFWSMSNVMPSVLRSAGDASFSSAVSLFTMWIFRVGLGYVAAIPMGLGMAGVWVCMGLEWAARTAIFYARYRSDVWLTKKTIE